MSVQPTDIEPFWELFGIGDEIYHGLTLADLDQSCVTEAQSTAKKLGLSWPPYFPELEDFALFYAHDLIKPQQGECNE